MKRKTTILLSSILAGSLLVGGAFAAYAVVDNANAIKVQVTPGAPVIPDTEVVLNWGEKAHANISGLQRDTLARLAYVTVTSDVDYTGIFSLLMEDATEGKVPNSEALFDHLEVYTYRGKVDLEQGEIPAGAQEITGLRILPSTQADEDGNKGYKLEVASDDTGVEFSIFVKLVVEEEYLGEMTDDVVEFTLDWGMNDDGHSHPYTPSAVPATEPGYYLVGTMTEWGPYTNTKFSATAKENELRLDNVELKATDAFKAYHIPEQGEGAYIPDGPDMQVAAGTYDILFAPTYRSDWETGSHSENMFGLAGHFWMIPHGEAPEPTPVATKYALYDVDESKVFVNLEPMEAKDFQGRDQARGLGATFKQGQKFKLYDNDQSTGWITTIESDSFGGAIASYITVHEGYWEAVKDFTADVYAKFAFENDAIYFGLPA